MKLNPAMHLANNTIKNQTAAQNTAVKKQSKMQSDSISDISFNGVEKKANRMDKFIARQVAKLSQTKASQGLVDITRKFKSAPARWCDLESVAVTLFYMWNTWKSDKIDDDRKVPSMIQNGAVTIASSAAAALVDAAFDPFVDKIALKYIDLYNKHPDIAKEIRGKNPKDFYGALKKLKSNTVFTAVVRFIIPVMMVPVVGKIVAKLNEKKKEQEEANKEAQTQTIAMQTQQSPSIQPSAVQQVQTSDIKDHDHDDDHDEHDDDDNKITDIVENKFKALFA